MRLPWRKEPYLLQLHLPTHHLARAAADQHLSRRKPNVAGTATDLPTPGSPPPQQSSPSWEVGVELDMAELQQDINAIMLEVEGGEEEQRKDEHEHEEVEGARVERRQGMKMQEKQQEEQQGEQLERQDQRQRRQQLQQQQQQQWGQRQQKEQQQQQQQQQLQQQSLDHQQHLSREPAPALDGSLTHASRMHTAHTKLSGTTSQATESPCWHGWWPLRASPRPFWRYIRQHKLQRWFGLDHFCVLLPHSYSRRLLVLRGSSHSTLLHPAASPSPSPSPQLSSRAHTATLC
ncbi:hypothetical protein DUNSADRAFT_18684 [Dunaliella salina]|uniref:Uncharacterized protein n=1 Tax=Dunaliella salina TaxID=3046 RepID=A0ABQ7FZN9_DUNSA|nr:hypothetical protein DUNSADRAFT_18684 [Dunaliella salina]|eukprot:KAF5827824.1 hypothetical protein DUNSADRAFT_18684 [Dunaliella salina]